ncbi:MAG: hypothetical protein HDT35_01145 [Clostridiales bacterium]|nr:hypothetical protein [Clostridiales bacterium]
MIFHSINKVEGEIVILPSDCGREDVNTYYRSGIWLCRRCWEEATP